jgi:hypothetical protein
MIFIRLGVLLSLFAMLAGVAVGQSTDRGKKSDEIVRKSRQLDLANHILPLILTKSQINELLPVIEKCRANVRKIENMEADDLLKMEAKIDKAISDALNKDQVPSKELLKEVAALYRAFTIRRQVAASENAEAVLEVLKRVLNEGQLKTAEKSIDPRAYDPKAEPDKMSQDDKLNLFIKDVLLDPQSYDFLVKLAKIKS